MPPFSKLKIVLVLFVVLLNGVFTPKARAATCDVGGTLFRDGVYGLIGGALVGGLWVLASEEMNNLRERMAVGALAGGAVGLGIGALDVALSDCTQKKPEDAAPTQEMKSRPIYYSQRMFIPNVYLGSEFAKRTAHTYRLLP